MLSKNRKDRIKIFTKWFVIALFVIILTAFATTGNPNNARPLMVIPVLVSISMCNNELVSGICGAFCGIMIDFACGKLMGVNAMIMLILAVTISLLCLHFLKNNLINAIWLTAVVAIIQGFFDFFFNFAIWNMEDYFTVAKVIILPSIIYTIMSSPIIYLIVKLILTKFAIKEKIEIKKDAGE